MYRTGYHLTLLLWKSDNNTMSAVGYFSTVCQSYAADERAIMKYISAAFQSNQAHGRPVMVSMDNVQGVHSRNVQGVYVQHPGCLWTQSRVSREKSRASMYIIQDVHRKRPGCQGKGPGCPYT